MSGVIYILLDWRAYVMLTLICMLAGVIMLIAEGIRYFGRRKALTEIGIN